MYVALLGTGNALPSADRSNTALALTTAPGAGVTMIDCGGDPFQRLMRMGIVASRVNGLLITHAHIDHIGGLPSLIESFRISGRTAPLPIFAIAEPLRVARALIGIYDFELTMNHWPFAIEFHELQSGTPVEIGDFTFTPMPTEHTVPSTGMRITTAKEPGVTVGYTCDTNLTPGLADIARDANLFLAEATYLHGFEEAAKHVGHMTTTQAAQVARDGKAHALALVHLSVGNAQEALPRNEARREFRGDVIVPRDGAVFQVGRNVRPINALP
jgi:ribonuclease Z